MRTMLFLLLLAFAGAAQTPATLHCERKFYPGGIWTNAVTVIYVTGGTPNVQYQVDTPYNRDVNSTNWSYTHRLYSRDFLAKPEAGELVVSSENDPNFRPRQFYRIGGVLPP